MRLRDEQTLRSAGAFPSPPPPGAGSSCVWVHLYLRHRHSARLILPRSLKPWAVQSLPNCLKERDLQVLLATGQAHRRRRTAAGNRELTQLALSSSGG